MNYLEIIQEIRIVKERMLCTDSAHKQSLYVVALIALYESALHALKREHEESGFIPSQEDEESYAA
jgi:hypothetical protein